MDVPADAYYTQSVNELYALGIVTGVGGGRFAPNASLSRQDAALMVQRALNQAGISAPDGEQRRLHTRTAAIPSIPVSCGKVCEVNISLPINFSSPHACPLNPASAGAEGTGSAAAAYCCTAASSKAVLFFFSVFPLL